MPAWRINRTHTAWDYPCGMHYVLLILGLVVLVIWDVNQNRARFTQPVAHFVYRVAGGH